MIHLNPHKFNISSQNCQYYNEHDSDEFDYYPDKKDMKLLDTDEQLEMKETYTSFLKCEYYKKMLSNYDFFED